MHKNCSHQSWSFWPRYAPNRLSAGASPQIPLGELIALPRPPSWFRGWDPRGWGRGRGEKGRGGGRWDWDPSTRDGKRGRNGGKDGGRRVGKGMGRKGRGGEEISIHGLKHVAPPMASS